MNKCSDWDLFRKGLEEYHRGHYIEAHEIWEDLWSDYSLPDRKFIQGFIQLAVCLVHLGNGKLKGARSLLHKSMDKVDPLIGHHRDIDMERLKCRLMELKIFYWD